MAKRKFGLGAQGDALWNATPTVVPETDDMETVSVPQNAGKNENDFSIAQENENVRAEQKKNLPVGMSVDENGQIFVELSRLRANPEQPRSDFDEEALFELASSIKEHGVLQAITVEDALDGTFYIIAGERRVRASKIAGLSKIPAQLRTFDDQKKLEVALIENIQRADLNAVEEALAYQRLMHLSSLTQEEVAERVGKKRATVANALRLLKLPSDMRDALVSGSISAGHARAILSVQNPNGQRTLFEKIEKSGMSVRKAEALALELNENGAKSEKKAKTSEKKSERPSELDEIEQKFIEAFGTKVSIKGSLSLGSIEISYFSKEDLNRLYEIVVKE